MVDDRKRPVWPWIVAVLTGLPVIYVASFGPAVWVMDSVGSGNITVSVVYRPMLALIRHGPPPLSNAILRYANLLARDRWNVELSLWHGYVLIKP